MPVYFRCPVRCATLIVLVSALTAVPARAQTSSPVEGFVSLNAALFRPTTTSLVMSTVVEDPPDRDEARTGFELGSQPGFDIGGGILVRRRLFMGMAVSRFTDSQPGTFTYIAQHPLFHPTLTGVGETGDLKRSEGRVDLQVGYAVPLSRRATVILFGGPSRFSLSQDLVADFESTEEFNPVTRTFRLIGPRSFEIEKSKASGWGYNVGADASVMLSNNFGVGGVVRYSRATLDIRDPLESLVEDRDVTKPMDVGGLQVSGGIRVRF